MTCLTEIIFDQTWKDLEGKRANHRSSHKMKARSSLFPATRFVFSLIRFDYLRLCRVKTSDARRQESVSSCREKRRRSQLKTDKSPSNQMCQLARWIGDSDLQWLLLNLLILLRVCYGDLQPVSRRLCCKHPHKIRQPSCFQRRAVKPLRWPWVCLGFSSFLFFSGTHSPAVS